MKKLLSVFVAMAFALSLAAVVVAAEKPAAAPTAAPAKSEPAKAEAAKPEPAKKTARVRAHRIHGTIESLDAAAGTFSVKSRKKTVELKAGEKVKLADFAVGDKVVAKYAEGTASSVKKVTGKTGAHKAMKKEAAPKTETAPAAPATK